MQPRLRVLAFFLLPLGCGGDEASHPDPEEPTSGPVVVDPTTGSVEGDNDDSSSGSSSSPDVGGESEDGGETTGWGTSGVSGPGGDGDTCPFSAATISCSAYCGAQLTYDENCDGLGGYTYEECVDACAYTVEHNLFDNDSGWGLEWYGCMQQTGGSCEAFSDCFFSTYC